MRHLDPTVRSAVPLLEEEPPSEAEDDAILAFLDRQYQAVDVVIDAYAAGDQATREAILEATSGCVDTFHSFAEWMAVLSIHEGDPKRIYRGILALALDNLRTDSRDTLVILSLLAHSARKLQNDEGPLFRSALALATPEFSSFVTTFLQQPVQNRAIGLMGYREAGEGKTFEYVRA